MARKKKKDATYKQVVKVYPHEEAILKSVKKESGKFSYEKWDKVLEKAHEIFDGREPNPRKKGISLDMKETTHLELKELSQKSGIPMFLILISAAEHLATDHKGSEHDLRKENAILRLRLKQINDLLEQLQNLRV